MSPDLSRKLARALHTKEILDLPMEKRLKYVDIILKSDGKVIPAAVQKAMDALPA